MCVCVCVCVCEHIYEVPSKSFQTFWIRHLKLFVDY